MTIQEANKIYKVISILHKLFLSKFRYTIKPFVLVRDADAIMTRAVRLLNKNRKNLRKEALK